MNDRPAAVSTVTFGITRKSLEAVLIHACPECGAPGVYKYQDERAILLWPGIVTGKMEMRDQPVGAICPNCGARRNGNRDLGELSASMPRWIWNCILAVKWCVVKLKHRRI